MECASVLSVYAADSGGRGSTGRVRCSVVPRSSGADAQRRSPLVDDCRLPASHASQWSVSLSAA